MLPSRQHVEFAAPKRFGASLADYCSWPHTQGTRGTTCAQCLAQGVCPATTHISSVVPQEHVVTMYRGYEVFYPEGRPGGPRVHGVSIPLNNNEGNRNEKKKFTKCALKYSDASWLHNFSEYEPPPLPFTGPCRGFTTPSKDITIGMSYFNPICNVGQSDALFANQTIMLGGARKQ